jgi:hypothetical protein
MRIEEFQQRSGKVNTLEPYNEQMRRFNLTVILGTLLVTGVGVALLALF